MEASKYYVSKKSGATLKNVSTVSGQHGGLDLQCPRLYQQGQGARSQCNSRTDFHTSDGSAEATLSKFHKDITMVKPRCVGLTGFYMIYESYCIA